MRLRGHLETNEYLILGTRSHPLALIPAAITLLGAAAIASFASSVMPTARILAYLALILAGWLTILALGKIIRWATTTYLLTNYRLIQQTGMLQNQHHSISLATVEAVDLKPSRLAPGKQADMDIYVLGRPYRFFRVPQATEYSRQIYRAQQQVARRPFSQ